VSACAAHRRVLLLTPHLAELAAIKLNVQSAREHFEKLPALNINR